jgi:hypothetical protein
MINDIPTDIEFYSEILNTPYSKSLDPYTSFPDPSPGELGYHAERFVTSINEFIKTFGHLIIRPDNRIKQFA